MSSNRVRSCNRNSFLQQHNSFLCVRGQGTVLQTEFGWPVSRELCLDCAQPCLRALSTRVRSSFIAAVVPRRLRVLATAGEGTGVRELRNAGEWSRANICRAEQVRANVSISRECQKILSVVSVLMVLPLRVSLPAGGENSTCADGWCSCVWDIISKSNSTLLHLVRGAGQPLQRRQEAPGSKCPLMRTTAELSWRTGALLLRRTVEKEMFSALV